MDAMLTKVARLRRQTKDIENLDDTRFLRRQEAIDAVRVAVERYAAGGTPDPVQVRGVTWNT
jgi:hypothetical protein